MQGEWAGEPVGADVWETCRELIPAGSVFAFLAEHRDTLFPKSMFADMYPSTNGRPIMPPQVLSAAVVLQSLYGVSDFEAVQELRCDLRWKAACGLGLHDTAFDPSLLTYFRRRLQRSADPNRIFTKVNEVVAATGVLKGKHRRALDSTVLDDAVATQDTVTQLVAAIRRVIREVPGADEVAARRCTAHDYTDPGKPRIAWNDRAARAELVDALVSDALNLLGRLPEQQHGDSAAQALALLALVAGQDVEPVDGSDGSDGRWQITKGTAHDRTVSTVDPASRHIHKNRSRHQEGFRAHAAFEPEAGLFTEVALTAGSGADNHEAAVAQDLLADENEDEDLTVLGDAAYGTGELRENLQKTATPWSSNPRRCGRPSPAASPPTTSKSTPPGALSPAQRATPSPSAAPTRTATARHSSRNSAATAPCASAAPPPKPDAPSTSTPSTTSSKPPAIKPPPTPTGGPSTDNGAHRWSAPWPGWSPEATEECPTEASSRTTPGSTTAPPPSTSAD